MNSHRHLTKRVRLSLAVILAGSISASAFAGHPTMGVAQDHMHQASDFLNKAKASPHPIEDLQTALNELNEALHNKQGHRAEAVPLVETAIADFKKGDRVGANKAIDEALAEIEKGVAAGHRNLKH